MTVAHPPQAATVTVTPRKPAAAAQERVGIREREEVLRGAKAHGAGAASPKERQARPAAEVLSAFEVEDDERDRNWDGTSTSTTTSPRGARALRPQLLSGVESNPNPDPWDVDALSELTEPPSPPASVLGAAALGGFRSGIIEGGSGSGVRREDGAVLRGRLDSPVPQPGDGLPAGGSSGNVPGTLDEDGARRPGSRVAVPEPDDGRSTHGKSGSWVLEDGVWRPHWRSVGVPTNRQVFAPAPPVPQRGKSGGDERSSDGVSGRHPSASTVASSHAQQQVRHPHTGSYFERHNIDHRAFRVQEDWPTRALRVLLWTVIALCSIFLAVHLISFTARAYFWSTALAQDTAQKLDVLYTVADDLALVLALALHAAIFVVQLGIGQLPKILPASVAVGVYVMWKKWPTEQP